MKYALALLTITAGITAIGIGWNNNGYFLFAAWGNLIKQYSQKAPVNSASAVNAVSGAAVGASGRAPRAVTPAS